MGTRREIQNELTRVLKTLKLLNLKTLIDEHPKITWVTVQRQIVSKKLLFSVKYVAPIIAKLIINTEPLENIPSQISYFRLIAASKNTSKVWNAYRMLSSENFTKQEKNSRQVIHSINRSLKIKDIIINTTLIEDDGKWWISIERKKKGSLLPVWFFVLFLNQRYIFTSLKSTPNDALNIIVRALGYRQSKICHLSGRSLESLLILLKNKERATHSHRILKNNLEFNSKKYSVTNSGIDFTLDSEKDRYVKIILGEDPPKLESLIIQTPKDNFKGLINLDSNFNMQLQLKSKHVLKMVQEMIKDDLINIPLPLFVMKVINAGKNIIQLKKL